MLGAGVLVTAGLLAGGVLDRDLLAGSWPAWLRSGVSSDPEPTADDAAPGAVPDRSVLLVSTDGAGAVRWLAVLAAPAPGGGGATVLLVPPGLLAEVPGHGTFTLGEAHGLGGTTLAAASLGNLLGVRLDATATVTLEGWGALVEAAGGIDVTLRAGVDDLERGIRLEPGPHRLDRRATIAVLDAAGPPLGELETLARVPPVLGGILAAVAETPTLAEDLTEVREGGAAALATDAPEVVAEVLRALAAARVAEELAVLTLPVAPIGDGPDAGFRIDVERAEPLLADRLGPWRPDATLAGGRDVQILNGNGVPRIGQRVSELLSDGGYRVVLIGNADRFTHETTRIILHDDTPEQVAVGQDVQRRMGVGELELAATPSSVVDVTIVVGQDFPPQGTGGS